MDKQLHYLLFVQGIAESAGLKDAQDMGREAKVIQIITNESQSESPNMATINALVECFTGKSSEAWMQDRADEYRTTIIESWKRVPKAERDKLLMGVCSEMIRCGLFSLAKPGFPIMPAAILAAFHKRTGREEIVAEDIHAADVKLEDYDFGIGQVLALWIDRKPTGHVAPWSADEIRGMYKDCVSFVVPEEI